MVTVTDAIESDRRSWNKGYEFKVVGLMTLGFGILGLDRFIVNPLFPLIQRDLGLTYQHLGFISSVLALAWGLASLFSGPLSDRIGCKRVIVPAMLIFSGLVATTGFAGGLLSLVLMRAFTGLAEGAFVPASIVTTVKASEPKRVGLNIGIQQMAMPLFGLGVGPLLVIALLKVVPSWQWVFAVAAIPGFIVAYFFWKVIRSDAVFAAGAAVPEQPERFWKVFRYRNVVFATLCMCCYLSATVTLSAFLPSYLADYLGLTIDQMGFVLTALGFGGLSGMLVVPALSDRFGRKLVTLTALLINLLMLLILLRVGAEPSLLFVLLFGASFMNGGVLVINVGPLTNESVPAAIAATATGLVVGVGEIFGGALMPAVAGGLADAMGIAVILKVAIVATAVAVPLVVFGIREPKAQLAGS